MIDPKEPGHSGDVEHRVVRSIGSIVVVALGVVIAASSACSDPVPLGGFDDSNDGAPPLSEGGTILPDANEFRPLCKSTRCPSPYSTCATDSFRCETNFDKDNDNCGACGVVCPSGEEVRAVFGAEWFCQSGECRMACDTQKHVGDCNNQVADGCESNLDCDPNNCGKCGNKCADGLACIRGNCGCAGTLSACGDNACDAECVNLKTNDFNCGECGHECPFGAPPPKPNMYLGCGDWTCGKLKCQRPWEDCNKDTELDGCEINTDEDPKNCGACGKACAPGQFCEFGSCKCGPSETGCGKAPYIFCTNLDTDPQNCGLCNNMCPQPYDDSGKPVCRLGHCEIVCKVGFADCDGRLENGCETQVSADPRNCGACGKQCDLAFGQPCVNGACLKVPCDDPGATQ